MMTETNVLERIRGLMKERKVKQTELASTLGVSETAISRLMSGARKLSAAELGAVADRLGTTTGYLLGRTSADVRPFAVAARLGSAAHETELDPVFARARTLLELRGVLDRLVEGPGRAAVVQVEPPRTTLYKDAGDQMAARLRAALELDDEPVVDLVELTESAFGVDVSLEPLPQALHGVFITDPDPAYRATRVAVMLVNSDDTYGRQRFTLAHELGHLLFDDAELFWADYRRDGKSLEELRANHFASAFLMPAGGVRQVAEKLGAAPGDVRGRHQWLAELVVETSLRFAVSIGAATNRLDNLGLLPTARDKRYLQNQSALALIDAADRNSERSALDELQHIVAPPPHLRDQALFAYSEGMVGIEPLAQLWRSENAEELRQELAAAGWEPAYA